jgi:hypothetical protein
MNIYIYIHTIDNRELLFIFTNDFYFMETLLSYDMSKGNRIIKILSTIPRMEYSRIKITIFRR